MQEFQLELLEKETALSVFQSDNGLDPIIQQTKDFISSFEHDLTTGVGRKRTASLASRVAKLKVKLDNTGKELTLDWKNKAKLVDSTRKKMREELDLLKIEARKPLTEWEEEQARIEAEEKAKAEAEQKAIQLEADHEIALILNDKFNLEKEKAEQERLRKEAEEVERQKKLEADRIAELERQAKINAEKEKQAEIDRIEKEARDVAEKAKAEKAQAEKEKQELERKRIQAEERAKAEAKLAEEKRLADIEKAKQAEIDRQKKEQERVEKDRIEREANEKHTSKIKNEAYQSLLVNGIDKESAQKCVELISSNKIKNITINF